MGGFTVKFRKVNPQIISLFLFNLDPHQEQIKKVCIFLLQFVNNTRISCLSSSSSSCISQRYIQFDYSFHLHLISFFLPLKNDFFFGVFEFGGLKFIRVTVSIHIIDKFKLREEISFFPSLSSFLIFYIYIYIWSTS